MPDAFTYSNGSEQRSFKSRKELYDYMVDRGEVILDGEDVAKFSAHIMRMNGNGKSNEAKAKLAEHGIEVK